MTRKRSLSPPVRGVRAPGPRITPQGAVLLALVVSLPVGLLLWVVEWLVL